QTSRGIYQTPYCARPFRLLDEGALSLCRRGVTELKGRGLCLNEFWSLEELVSSGPILRAICWPTVSTSPSSTRWCERAVRKISAGSGGFLIGFTSSEVMSETLKP